MSSDNRPRIVVVGAGVIGLTCALTLLKDLGQTCQIEVFAAGRGQQPPNALWEYPPYNMFPKDLVRHYYHTATVYGV